MAAEGKCRVYAECSCCTCVIAVLPAAMGLSAARATLPGASPKSGWVAAAGQHYPAQGATVSFAGSSLSVQRGRASDAPHCQQRCDGILILR